MKISEYYGLDMYSDNGNYIGEVEEIFLDFDKGKIAGFAFDRSGGKWVAVPYENVMAAGEIIIIRSKKKKEEIGTKKVE